MNAAILVFLSGSLLFGAAPDAPAPEGKMKVFILSGQSNMVGQGDAKSLPEDLAGTPENVFMFSKGKWQPFEPGGGRFGPEVTFVREMAKAWPGQKIGIVKYAKGGTSLSQWDPDLAGSLYEKLMTLVKAAREEEDFEVAGMLWMQGERDSKNEAAAKAYAENFKSFIARVRQDLERPELPFLFGRINNKGNLVELVRKAQEETPANVPGTAMIDCDGLSKKSDNLHYDTEGQLEMGRLFAAAYLKLTEEEE